MMNQQDIEKIKSLIEDDKENQWYTIKQLSSLTNFNETEIAEALLSGPDFICSSYLSKDNLRRFTTRNDYNKNASVFSKVLGAFKNRID